MAAKVHPLLAALVTLSAIAALSIWAWGTGQAKSVGGPSQLAVAPDGHFFLQVGHSLLEHDEAGNFIREHDLRALGVERSVGGIAFFSNGDLLVRRGSDTRSLLDNLRALRRASNPPSIEPDAAASGLARCRLAISRCGGFGSPPIDIKAAYGVFIDWQTDHVYLSDTTRHVLRKYDGDGRELAPPASGFRFPNGIVLVDGRLMLADTNHRRVVALDPANDRFADELDSIDVVPGAAQRAGHAWPNDVVRVGDHWWVNLVQSDMSFGGIYVFDDNWRFRLRIPLPPGADPVDLLPFGNEILVSDWHNETLWRIDAATLDVAPFSSRGLAATVARSEERRRHYETVAWLGIALFGIVLAALLTRAVGGRSSRESAGPPPRRTTGNLEFANEMIWLEPDPRKVRRFRIVAGIVAGLFAILVPAVLYLLIFWERPGAYYPLGWAVAGLAAAYLFIGWVTHVNLKSAVGLCGSTITLRDHRGREKRFPLTAVEFDGSTVAAGDMAVFMGAAAAPLYEQQSVMEHLYPRLALAQSVSVWAMQAKLIRLRHPQGLLMLGMFLGLVAVAFWLLGRQL